MGLYDRWRDECIEQVANGPASSVDLTPASEVPADTVRAGWLPLFPGQEVPLIWENVPPDDEC